MTYTKPWTSESQASQDDWHQWLATHAFSALEYQLIYWEDHIDVEFFDQDRCDEFAQEFGI
jgi:lipopolysaccharide biosynthesis glycosyltransferase